MQNSELLKQKFEDVVEKRNKNIEEVNQLKENPLVKRYIEITEENEKLFGKIQDLRHQYRQSIYKECHHIWVYHTDFQYDEKRLPKYCIKCGLDLRVYSKAKALFKRLGLEESEMYTFLTNNDINLCKSIDTEVCCDVVKAKEAYKRIIEENPSIDDETAVEYFKTAITNSRKTSKRKTKQKKRDNKENNV